MSSVNYRDIADLSWSNIQEPKVVPDGSYLLRLSNAVFQPSNDESKSPRVMFVHSIKEAMEDVKTDALEALGEDYDITENKVFTTIFIEDGASWKKVEGILNKHGVPTTGKVVDDLKKAKNSEVIGYLVSERYARADGTPGEKNKVTEFASVE